MGESSNTISFDSNFSHRVLVYLPLFLIYKIFPYSIHSTNFWPLLSVIFVAIAVFRIVPKNNHAFAALAICTCMPLLNASLYLLPDIISTGQISLGFIFLSKQIKEKNNRFSIAFALAFFIFLGFLAKETALYFFGIVAAVLVYSKMKNFLYKFLISSALIFTAYFAIYYLVFGNMFFRFEVINGNRIVHLWSSSLLSTGDLWYRFTIGPPLLLITQYKVSLFFCLQGLLVYNKEKWVKIAFLLFLFAYWFGPVSVSPPYTVLPLECRMIEPLLPAAILLITSGIARQVERVKHSSGFLRNFNKIVLLFILVFPIRYTVRNIYWLLF